MFTAGKFNRTVLPGAIFSIRAFPNDGLFSNLEESPIDSPNEFKSFLRENTRVVIYISHNSTCIDNLFGSQISSWSQKATYGFSSHSCRSLRKAFVLPRPVLSKIETISPLSRHFHRISIVPSLEPSSFTKTSTSTFCCSPRLVNCSSRKLTPLYVASNTVTLETFEFTTVMISF